MFTIRNLSLAMATTVAAKSAEKIRKDALLIGAAGSTFGLLAHDYQIEKQVQGLNAFIDKGAIDTNTGKVVATKVVTNVANRWKP